jgi:hypothetical protein
MAHNLSQIVGPHSASSALASGTKHLINPISHDFKVNQIPTPGCRSPDLHGSNEP